MNSYNINRLYKGGERKEKTWEKNSFEKCYLCVPIVSITYFSTHLFNEYAPVFIFRHKKKEKGEKNSRKRRRLRFVIIQLYNYFLLTNVL